MSKIRFVIDNHVDTSVLSVDPAVDVNLPINNIKESARSKVTRTIDSSNQAIRGTFNSVKDVSAFILGSHNFVVDMQYQLYLYNNTALDTQYNNTGGTESTTDTFYISGNHAGTYSDGLVFDVVGDAGYNDTCSGGTNNGNGTPDILNVTGDVTSKYVTGNTFEYISDTSTTANRRYTVISSVFNTPDTLITVEENTNVAIFDGTLQPYAEYTVGAGGGIDNTSMYNVTGGVDNTDPTNDIFYVAGDQTAIFNRAISVTCSGDTNIASNITYTIVNVVYTTQTEITIEEDITGHAFDGTLLPIYTSIPVVSNTITNPIFDGILIPDFQIWTSGIKTVTTDTVGSSLWEWGSFLWGVEAWGADREKEQYTPPSHIIEWISPYIPQVRGFKIEIYLAGGTTSYFELGRLFIGKYIEPTYNMGYGHSLTWQETTKQYRTDSGSLRSDNSVPFRKLEFNLGTITEIDRITLQHELRNVGLRKDIFVSMFPEDSSNDKKLDYSGIVKLTKVPKFTEFAQNYYKAKYTMEEV